MEKYIIIALILLFGIVYYFDTQSDNKFAALEQSSTLEKDVNKPKQDSFFKTVINHMTQPKKKSNNVFYQNHPDSDRSQCSQFPTVDEKITTNFAGYVLEYPCTAIGSGHISIAKKEDGSLQQDYKLTLGMRLGADKISPWSLGINENRENTQSFLIFLKSNGKVVKKAPIIDYLKKSKKIMEVNPVGLDVYLYPKTNRVTGVLKNYMDAIGIPPTISCLLNKDEEIRDLFSSLYNIKYKYQTCTGHWMLTKDINVVMYDIKGKYAYHYKEIYQAINQGLLNTIIERPNKIKTEQLVEKYIQSQLKPQEK